MESEWPLIKLREVLSLSRDAAIIDPLKSYKQVKVRLHHKGVALRCEKQGGNITSKQYLTKTGQFIISRIDARNGAMGLVPPELDGAIVTNDFLTYDFDKIRLSPKYFNFLTTTKSFVEKCVRVSEGTTNRVRLKPEKFLNISIPLPPLEEQKRIVIKIEKMMARIGETREFRRVAEEENERLFDRILKGIFFVPL